MDEQKEPLWWLSLADDAGFRGVVLVRGASDTKAIRLAHALGCNPGGEVLAAEIPDEGTAFIIARDPGLLGRLLDKGEAQALSDALDARFNNEDSPGIPPGQAAGGEPVAARDAEGEEPGPGDGVTSPARVPDEGGRVLASPSTWLPPGASEPEPDPFVRLLLDAAPGLDAEAIASVERVRARLFGKDGGT